MTCNCGKPPTVPDLGPIEPGDFNPEYGMYIVVNAMPIDEWVPWAKREVAGLLDQLLGFEDLDGVAVDHAVALMDLFGGPPSDEDDDVDDEAGEWQT